MHKLFYLIFVIIVLTFPGCSNKVNNSGKNMNSKPVEEYTFEEAEKDLNEETKSDIFKIEKKSVVFFSINKNEAQILTKELGESYRWETEALFNSFTDQAKTFKDILQKHNINCFLSHNQRFEIKLKNGNIIDFDRMKVDQILGEILTNGEKEPMICFGMYKNKELAELIQEYFGIQDLGYIPVDSLENNNNNNSKADSAEIKTPSQ
jgi:hypothetical protein